jgi:hypothetical protein
MSPIDVDRLGFELQKHPDRHFVEYLLSGLRFEFLFNCLDWTLGCFEYVTESVFVGIVVFVCFPALEDWHSFNPCVLLEHCMQACSSLQSLIFTFGSTFRFRYYGIHFRIANN